MNPKLPKNTLPAVAVLLFLTIGQFDTRAQSLTWDPGLTGGSGGTGTWDLNSTANWWNGAADIKWLDSSAKGTNGAVFGGTAGAVTLNTSLSVSNLQFNTTGYTLSGSGTLTLGAGGINAGALTSGTTTIGNALSLSGGQQLWQVGSGGTLAINGAVSRIAGSGATVDFATNGVTSTTLANNNGIIGGWATMGDTISSTNTGDFLSVSNGSIVICTNYMAVSSGGSSTPGVATIANSNLVSGILNGANAITHVTNSVTINSLIAQGDFDVSNNATMTIGSGGFIFRGPSRWILQNNGGNQGPGSSINSGLASGELFLHSPNASQGDWRVWPQVKDNSGVPVIVVKDGPGVVVLQNVNNLYTGGTIINNGVLAPGRALTQLTSTNLGSGLVTVNPAGILEVGYNSGAANSDAFISNNIVVQGGKVLENDGHIHLVGSITVSNYGATFGSSYDGAANSSTGNKALFLDGILSGTTPITLQQAADAGEYKINGNEGGNSFNSSVVCISNNANTYSGTITIIPYATGAGAGSYLAVNGASALQLATINPANNTGGQRYAAQGSSVIFNTGISSYTLGAITGSGSIMLSNWNENTYARSGTITLSVGNNNSNTTYAGSLIGNGGFNKIGTGTLTLSGTSTVGGNMHVKSGTEIITGNVTNNNFSDVGVTTGDNAVMTILNGGTFYNTSDFNLGDVGNSVGVLNLAAGANLNVNAMFVSSANASGSTAAGTVYQTNGTVLVRSGGDGALTIGGRNGASALGVGIYNLMAGSVSVPNGGNTWLGGYGQGTMNQTGGSFSGASWTSIGRQTGSTGTWNISGAAMLTHSSTTTRIIVGESGTGRLNVTNTAQVSTTGGVRLAANSTANGTVNLDGGTITTPVVETTGTPGTSTFNFNGGTLQAGASTATFMQGLTAANVKNGGAVIDCQANNITIAQPLLNGGAGGLAKLGGGTLKLSGANAYVGNTVISAGVLQNGAVNTVPGGSTVSNSATWDLNAFSDTVAGLLGAGTVDNTAAGSPVLTVNNSVDDTFSGVIKNTAGTLGLAKSGSAALMLSGVNTYSGNTTVNGGTLVLGAGGSISNSAQIFANGTLDVSPQGGFYLNGAIGQTIGGSGVVTGSVFVATGGRISPGNSAGTLTFTNDLSLAGGATNLFELSNVTTVGSGVNDLIVVGGNFAASGLNTILVNPTGGNLASGTYTLFKYGIPHGSSLAANFTVAYVTAPPRVSVSIVDNLGAQEIDLVVTANPAALVWQGTNSSTWDATFTTNWLNGAASDAFYTGDNVVFDNTSTNPAVNLTGTLNPNSVTVNGTTNYTFGSSGKISGVTSLVNNNSGTLTVLTTNDYSGGTLNGAGTLQVGNGTVSGSLGSGNITNNGSLVYNHADTITLAQVVSGTGALTHQGNGTLNLNSTNTYAGGTAINGGTVAITNDAALGVGGGSLAFNGGTLQTANSNVLNNRGVTLNSGGGTLSTLTSASLQVSNVITGAGALTKAGAGTLIVNGANDYSGGTTVSAGTLQIGAGVGGTVGTGPVTNNAALQIARSDDFTFANPVTGSGFFVKAPSSTGTMTMQSANQYLATGSGIVQVNGGTLVVDAAGSLTSGGELWIAQNVTTGACVVAGGTLIASNWIAVGRNNNAAVGTLTLNSGSVQKYGAGNISVGSLGGNGTINVNGGSLYCNTSLLLAENAGAQGQVNLNGGTIQAVNVANQTSGAGTSTFRFNGGTLSPVTNNSSFFTGLSQALVQSGGAVFDDAGFNIGVNQALLNDTGSPGGGLVKKGPGTLTLSQGSTYTGGTVVSNGVLKLNQDAVLHFTFDSASGSGAGSVVTNTGTGGSAMNGLLVGNGVNIVGGGRYGSALSFDGAGGASFTNIVVVSNSVVSTSGSGGNWSVGVWVKTSTVGAEWLYQGSGSWASGNSLFYLTSASGSATGTNAGMVRFAGGFLRGTAVLNDGNWHFVMVTDTGGTMTQYVDGSVDAYAFNSWNGSAGTGSMWWIGGSPDTLDGNVHFNGLIDEVYMFNRGLSQAEVQSLYNANNSGGQTLPVATSVNLAASTAALNLGGVSQTVSGLAGPAGSSIVLGDASGGGNFTVSNSVDNAFAGTISGSGTFTKNGGATLTLTGAGTYAGSTFVKAGTLVIDSGGSLSGGYYDSIGQVNGDNGTLTLKGTGSLNAGGNDFNVGDVGNSTGTLNVEDSASLSAGALFIGSANAAGSTASGTVNQTGGSVAQTGSGVGLFVIGGRASASGTGAYNLSGGTLTAAAGIRVGSAGVGAMSVSGSAVVNASAGINIARLAGSTGTLNLDGGTVNTLNLTSSTGVNATNNFNGATVKPVTNNVWISGLTQCNVRNGGAIFDTAGFTVTNAQALAHSVIAGDSAVDGGVVKNGAGALVMTAASTYVGNTLINAGTLALGSGGSIDDSGSIAIAAGGALDVSAISSFTLSGSTTLRASGSLAPAAIIGASGGSVSLGSQPVVLTYDGSNPALTVSQGTLVLNGNAFTVNTASPLAPGSYPIVQQAAGSVTSSGSLTVAGTAIGAGTAGSLSVSGGTVNLVIQNITATALTRTAGGSPSMYGDLLTFHAIVSPDPGDGSVITFLTNGVAVGAANTASGAADFSTSGLPVGGSPYSVTAVFGGNATNAGSSAALTGGQQVNPAPLSVTASNAGKAYDGVPYSGGNGVSYSGFVNGENSSALGGTLSYGGDSQGAVAVGTYTITPSGYVSGNYAITYHDGTLTISQGSSTISYGGATFTYNGAAQSPTVTFAGSSGAQTTAYSGASYLGDLYAGASAPTNAGSYTVSNSVAADANYAGTNATFSFTILQATNALALTLGSATSTYGQDVSFTAAVQTNAVTAADASSNVVFSVDSLPVSTNALVNGTASYTNNSLAAGAHSITAAYLGDNNYTNSASATNILTVDKATPAAVLAVNNSPVTFDGSGHAAAVGITSSSVPGAVQNVLTGGAASQTNAGSYAVTADFVPSDTANYSTLTGIAVGNFVIQQAIPVLAVANSPVTYDGTPHAAVVNASVPGTVANVKYGGSGTVPAAAGTNVVTADFTPDDAVNYSSLTNAAAGSFVISQAALSITANNTNKVYGQTITFAGTEFTSSGLVAGDTVTSVTLVSDGAAAGAAVGNHDIVPAAAAGSGLGNYTITYVNGTLAVTAAGSPVAQSIAVSNGSAVIAFLGTANVTYVTQAAPDLSGPWTAISTNTPASGTWSVTNSVTGADQKFYRTVIP